MDTIILPVTAAAMRTHLRTAHDLAATVVADADLRRLVAIHDHEHDHADELELEHRHPGDSAASAAPDVTTARAALADARARHAAALGHQLAAELAPMVAAATGITPVRIDLEVYDHGRDLAIHRIWDAAGTEYGRDDLDTLMDVNEFDAPTSHEFCDVAGDGDHDLTVPATSLDVTDQVAAALEPHRHTIVAAAATALADADVPDTRWDGVQVMFEDVDGIPVAYPNISAAIDDPEVRDTADTMLERAMKADRHLHATVADLAATHGPQLWDVCVHLPRDPEPDPSLFSQAVALYPTMSDQVTAISFVDGPEGLEMVDVDVDGVHDVTLTIDSGDAFARLATWYHTHRDQLPVDAGRRILRGRPVPSETLLAEALGVDLDQVAQATFAAVRDTGEPVHVAVEFTDGSDRYLYPTDPAASVLFDHLTGTVDWDDPDDGYDDRGEWFLLDRKGTPRPTSGPEDTSEVAPPHERDRTATDGPRTDDAGGRWSTLAELKDHLAVLHGYTGGDYRGTDVVADVDGTYGWATGLHTHEGDHQHDVAAMTAAHHHRDDGTVVLGHVVTWEPADPNAADPSPFGAVSLPDAAAAHAFADRLRADLPADARIAVVDATQVPVPPLLVGFSRGDLLDALDNSTAFQAAVRGDAPADARPSAGPRLLDDPSQLRASQRRQLVRELSALLQVSRRRAYTLVDDGLPVDQLAGHLDQVAAIVQHLR